MYPVSPATSRHWLRSYHGQESHLRLELSSRLGVRWAKALPPNFSTADLAETWCRTSARCLHPPLAGSARAAVLTGREDVFILTSGSGRLQAVLLAVSFISYLCVAIFEQVSLVPHFAFTLFPFRSLASFLGEGVPCLRTIVSKVLRLALL